MKACTCENEKLHMPEEKDLSKGKIMANFIFTFSHNFFIYMYKLYFSVSLLLNIKKWTLVITDVYIDYNLNDF